MNQQPTNQQPSSGQNWLLIGVAVGVIVIFLIGVVGGQVFMRTLSDVDSLKKNYSQLSEQLGGPQKTQTGKSLPNKIAVVDTARVFRDFKGAAGAAQQFGTEREKKQKELEQLQKDYDSGKISSAEFQQRQAKLVSDLQNLDFQLSAPIQRKMMEIIREIGRVKSYLMIMNNQEGNLSVLYSKEDDIEDITDEVLAKMNEGQ